MKNRKRFLRHKPLYPVSKLDNYSIYPVYLQEPVNIGENAILIKPSLTVSASEVSFDLPVSVFLRCCFPLVIKFLTSCQGDLHLDQAVFEIDL